MRSNQELVFLQVLADRALVPAAVLLEVSGTEQDSAQTWQQLATQTDLLTLSASIACFVRSPVADGLPSELNQALLKAACQRLDDAVWLRSDGLTKPVLPAQSQWLAGDWVLAAPAKLNARQSGSRALALKLVQLVVAEADTRDIEDVFRQDPGLSYQLLRLVNSVGMGSSRRITSFSQAILLLGRQQLRRWLNLMLFSANSDDYRSAMLLARVTQRSRALELLARQTGMDRAAQELAFMTGMFSMLGVLFGWPLSEVFKPLQISEVLVAAVLRHEGEIGQLLRLVELFERRDAVALMPLFANLQLSVADFNQINLQACHWMLGVVRAKPGDEHE
jgi:EAL and modified HD-GYP domain-containing signal transduction protein